MGDKKTRAKETRAERWGEEGSDTYNDPSINVINPHAGEKEPTSKKIQSVLSRSGASGVDSGIPKRHPPPKPKTVGKNARKTRESRKPTSYADAVRGTSNNEQNTGKYPDSEYNNPFYGHGATPPKNAKGTTEPKKSDTAPQSKVNPTYGHPAETRKSHSEGQSKTKQGGPPKVRRQNRSSTEHQQTTVNNQAFGKHSSSSASDNNQTSGQPPTHSEEHESTQPEGGFWSNLWSSATNLLRPSKGGSNSKQGGQGVSGTGNQQENTAQTQNNPLNNQPSANSNKSHEYNNPLHGQNTGTRSGRSDPTGVGEAYDSLSAEGDKNKKSNSFSEGEAPPNKKPFTPPQTKHEFPPTRAPRSTTNEKTKADSGPSTDQTGHRWSQSSNGSGTSRQSHRNPAYTDWKNKLTTILEKIQFTNINNEEFEESSRQQVIRHYTHLDNVTQEKQRELSNHLSNNSEQLQLGEQTYDLHTLQAAWLTELYHTRQRNADRESKRGFQIKKHSAILKDYLRPGSTDQKKTLIINYLLRDEDERKNYCEYYYVNRDFLKDLAIEKYTEIREHLAHAKKNGNRDPVAYERQRPRSSNQSDTPYVKPLYMSLLPTRTDGAIELNHILRQYGFTTRHRFYLFHRKAHWPIIDMLRAKIDDSKQNLPEKHINLLRNVNSSPRVQRVNFIVDRINEETKKIGYETDRILSKAIDYLNNDSRNLPNNVIKHFYDNFDDRLKTLCHLAFKEGELIDFLEGDLELTKDDTESLDDIDVNEQLDEAQDPEDSIDDLENSIDQASSNYPYPTSRAPSSKPDNSQTEQPSQSTTPDYSSGGQPTNTEEPTSDSELHPAAAASAARRDRIPVDEEGNEIHGSDTASESSDDDYGGIIFSQEQKGEEQTGGNEGRRDENNTTGENEAQDHTNSTDDQSNAYENGTPEQSTNQPASDQNEPEAQSDTNEGQSNEGSTEYEYNNSTGESQEAHTPTDTGADDNRGEENQEEYPAQDGSDNTANGGSGQSEIEEQSYDGLSNSDTDSESSDDDNNLEGSIIFLKNQQEAQGKAESTDTENEEENQEEYPAQDGSDNPEQTGSNSTAANGEAEQLQASGGQQPEVDATSGDEGQNNTTEENEAQYGQGEAEYQPDNQQDPNEANGPEEAGNQSERERPETEIGNAPVEEDSNGTGTEQPTDDGLSVDSSKNNDDEEANANGYPEGHPVKANFYHDSQRDEQESKHSSDTELENQGRGTGGNDTRDGGDIDSDEETTKDSQQHPPTEENEDGKHSNTDTQNNTASDSPEGQRTSHVASETNQETNISDHSDGAEAGTKTTTHHQHNGVSRSPGQEEGSSFYYDSNASSDGHVVDGEKNAQPRTSANTADTGSTTHTNISNTGTTPQTGDINAWSSGNQGGSPTPSYPESEVSSDGYPADRGGTRETGGDNDGAMSFDDDQERNAQQPRQYPHEPEDTYPGGAPPSPNNPQDFFTSVRFDNSPTSRKSSPGLFQPPPASKPGGKFDADQLERNLDKILYEPHNKSTNQGFVGEIDFYTAVNPSDPDEEGYIRPPLSINSKDKNEKREELKKHSYQTIDFHLAPRNKEQAIQDDYIYTYPEVKVSEGSFDKTISLNLGRDSHSLTAQDGHYDYETLTHMIRLGQGVMNAQSVNVGRFSLESGSKALQEQDMPASINESLRLLREPFTSENYPSIKPPLLAYAIAQADDIPTYVRDQNLNPGGTRKKTYNNKECIKAIAQKYYQTEIKHDMKTINSKNAQNSPYNSLDETAIDSYMNNTHTNSELQPKLNELYKSAFRKMVDSLTEKAQLISDAIKPTFNNSYDLDDWAHQNLSP